MWTATDVTFDLVAEWTEHPVVTVHIRTPAGEMTLMAEPAEEANGRVLRLLGTHMDSEPGPNRFGAAALRAVAQVAMELLDYDEIIVEGAARTTGAGPGRTPRPIRFTRRSGAPASG